MTPAQLRALAARAETEAPSDGLNEEVARALGWRVSIGVSLFLRWAHPVTGALCRKPDPYLTDLTAAASAMPSGWFVWFLEQQSYPPWGWRCHFKKATIGWPHAAESEAPTEPRARVAAALRARAAEMEASNG